MTRFLILVLPILCCLSCSKDKIYVETQLDQVLENLIKRSSATGTYEHFILPNSNDYNNIPQEPKNPLSAEKVALGKMLFFETGLALGAKKPSSVGTYSCASCHIPSAGFRPGSSQGIADGGLGFGHNGEARTKFPNYAGDEIDAQGVRPLSLLNVAYVTNTLWNGQFGAGDVNEGTEALWDDKPETAINALGLSGLESQNIVGLDLHRMVINKEVLSELGYKEDFDLAFPELSEEDRYGKMGTSFAISAYLRTLVSTDAPFQDYLKGDKNAMTDQQKKGAILFFDKANCVKCHKGKSFNAMNFYALGVNDLHMIGAFNTDASDKKNLGRGGFTHNEEDMYKFKVPQLYNLKDAPFFFHGSSKETLDEVIDYFNDGVGENPNVPEEQISQVFVPLGLTGDEKADLKAFLADALHDGNLERYRPQVIRSGNCYPNNDPFSRQDLGCD